MSKTPKKKPQNNPGVAVDMERKVTQANRWRDQWNPLRNLTMATAVTQMEAALRGEFADFQWTCSFVERRDPDLLAIIERRTGMIERMDWDIKTVERRFKQRGQPFDSTLAQEQQACLHGQYDLFKNLGQAVAHLSLAVFRGYSHIQWQAEGQILPTLNCLDQWNIIRDGLYGDWFWNPDGLQRSAKMMKPEDRLDPNAYLIRTVPRLINEIAIIKFLRQNLSSKDWDAFLEIYGIPGWIIIGPPNIPTGKESEFETTAASVATGGSGYLPNGSTAECADQPRGISPFKDHLNYWSEKLVLAGTGGLLTMLSAPGSGTLAGGAHWEAFQIIATAEAKRISEVFQRSIDTTLLARNFPGRPALAYFDLCSQEEQDPGTILEHVVKITNAGGQPDWSQISEKTGYTIIAAPKVSLPTMPGLPLRNRAASEADLRPPTPDLFLKTRNAQLQAWFTAFEKSLPPKATQAQYLSAFETAVKNLPKELLTEENIAALAAITEPALAESLVQGIASKEATK
jgi:phage gp29-like protein